MARHRILRWPLAVCMLCLVAIVPLLRADSPCTHDGPLHYFRVAAMRHALKDGVLFTRYLPDLAFGYGYPFFNYRAPLSYYLALALTLTGLALPLALNLVYVLSIVGSALAAYLLARDLFGLRAGVVAAVAYAYAPYQFVDALTRANAPESIALALMPLTLWAFRRLALTGRRNWFLISVGSLVALYLTHNISSLLFTPFLMAYLCLLWLTRRGEGHWATTVGALSIALGLTAFFWGPALLEKDYVQLYRSHSTRNNDFHYNFIALAEILAPPAPMDTALMNPPMRIPLGLTQTILAGLGLAVGLIRWRDRERRATLIFLALAAGAMLWMSTRASLWLWEHIPLLPFVQFPWRFVGRAALPVALLAGAVVPSSTDSAPYEPQTAQTDARALPTIRKGQGTALSLVATLIPTALLILSALPDTYPPYGYCPSAANPTIEDVFAYEHQSKLVGVDPEGSYFPIWVKRLPEGSPLEGQYATGDPIKRFDDSALPEKASIVEADYGPNRARVTVESPSPFRARYLVFYFPGWRVTVDGDPAPIAPTDPEGLIAFDVPAGRHTVVVRFGLTPIRAAFATLSVLSLVALTALILILPSRVKVGNGAQIPRSLTDARRPRLHGALIVLAVLLLAFKLTVVDRIETPFRRPALRADGSLRGVQVPLQIHFNERLALLGYDLPSTPAGGRSQDEYTVRADDSLALVLYWRALRPLDTDHVVSLELVDDQGRRYGQKEIGHHMQGWEPDAYVRDPHQLAIWPGTPPGPDTLTVGVYDVTTGHSLDVRNAAGAPVGTTLPLTSIRVTRSTQTGVVSRPIQSPDPDSLEIAHPLTADLGGGLRLLGVDPPPARVDAGDHLPLTLYWQAVSAPDGDYTARLSLVGPDSADMDPASADTDQTSVAQQRATPGRASHPTSAWLPGDLVRDGRSFLIPAATPTGEYTLQLDLLDTAGTPLAPATELLDVTVHAPERSFTLPAPQHPITASLENLAVLLGYDLSGTEIAPGQSFTCTLYWQAQATADVDPDRLRSAASAHVVFVHLLDESERIQAQSDRVPAGGSRPTTGWLPGEVIEDPHPLTVAPDAPAGRYVLEIGMYDPASGQRLRVLDERGADAGDNIRLPTSIRIE